MLTVDFDRLGIVGGDTVLDLGSGPGRHSFEVQRRGARPIAVDLDRSALGVAAGMMAAVSEQEDVPSGSCAVGDALALPFSDDSFERIIASEVLEHIPLDSAAMHEIARVLKPGGTAAVSVPRFWPEGVCWGLSKDYRTSEGGHVRIYRRSQLIERLSSCGLKPYATHHAHALHSPYWWLRCAFGLDGKGALPRSYHRFLVWDIENPHSVIRAFEKGLDPLLGKSLVVYLQKDHVAATSAPISSRFAAQT